MKPVLGIDLGTTNTAAAWIDEEGRLDVVDVADESSSLPSVISLLDTGTALVGEQAKEMLGERPKSTFYGLKRLLGRRFSSDFVARNRDRFTFDLAEGAYGEVCIEFEGNPISLSDMMVYVVERIVELANACAEIEFEECVVSVPAHFTFRQRLITRQVVERVLRVRAMINEPTAAALMFANEAKHARNILVYDLGGGTFDVTLLKVADGEVKTLASGGDAFLGGIDFDLAIADHLLRTFREHTKQSEDVTRVAAHRIVLAAERAKISLSSNEQTDVRVPGVVLHGDHFLDLEEKITRSKTEEVCAPLIERTIGIVERTLKSVGSPKVDEVVLVGGQTQAPAVMQRLHQVLGIQPRRSYSADLAVASGAALHASGLASLSDVTSVPVYLAVPGGSPRELLGAHTRLPSRSVVSIQERPAAGQPLKLLLYEAVDVSSTERDIIGACTVPADWLSSVQGAFELEALLSPGHDLTLVANASGAESRLLPLVDVREAQEKAIEATAPDVTTDPGAEKLHTIDEVVGVRHNQLVPFVPLQMVRVSQAGCYVAFHDPPQPGLAVEIQMSADDGPIRLRAVTGHALRGEQAQEEGLPTGVDLRFATDQDEALKRLGARLALLEDRLSVGGLPSQLGQEPLPDDEPFDLEVAQPSVAATPPPSGLSESELFGDDEQTARIPRDGPGASPAAAAPPTASSASVQSLSRPVPRPGVPQALNVEMMKTIGKFIQAMRRDALYDALGIEPEASTDEVNTHLDLMGSLVKRLIDTVRPDLAQRLHVAIRLLESIRAVMNDPGRRRIYDFKKGHVRAAERLAAAGDDSEAVAGLRRAWIRCFPQRAIEAQKVVAVMRRAIKKEDLELGLDAGTMALKLDPFNLALRSDLDKLRMQVKAKPPAAAAPASS